MEVVHVFQEHEAYCGPAVAQMVLARFGTVLTQEEIAKELETDLVVGTSARELETFFTRRGFVVERHNNSTWGDIAAALMKGTPIVGYIEKNGDPHYAIVRGVEADTITLADPSHGDNFVLRKEEFIERWVDNADARYGDHFLLTVASSQAN